MTNIVILISIYLLLTLRPWSLNSDMEPQTGNVHLIKKTEFDQVAEMRGDLLIIRKLHQALWTVDKKNV